MRNLKRVLALAMAMVMILGMMVIGSSAASYSDADAISDEYVEAVEVLTGLGVFKGTDTGFAPKQILDRASAAALIYRVITGDVTDKQVQNYDYSSFNDVAAGEWYTGYVTYAANGGYIKGYDGKFMPGDTVTGIQVMAIMLRAAGYGLNGEYEGAAWMDNILTDAKELGITGNISTATLAAPATRELVAQLIFNAISKVERVDYNLLEGYKTTGETLGEKVFALTEIDGVVTANEYADLYDDEPLKAGKTEINGVVYSGTTALTDIGESRVGWAAGAKTKTILYLADSGDNTVYETGAKTDISTDKKFEKVTGMENAAECYLNFDGEYTVWTSEYLITYGIGDDLTTYNPKKDKEIDIDALEDVFYAENGAVYVGTKSTQDNDDDKSDTMTWKKFCATYLESAIDSKAITSTVNGDWLKVIDNDADGKADYVFKTEFAMAQIDSINKKATKYELTTLVDEPEIPEMEPVEIDTDETPIVTEDELAERDIVLYTYIDGVYYMNIAEVVVDTIDKKGISTKNGTITCGDNVYGQSGIDYSALKGKNADILDADTQVSYDFYLDAFGYVRLYEASAWSNGFVLLTDAYFESDRRADDIFKAEIWNEGYEDVTVLENNPAKNDKTDADDAVNFIEDNTEKEGDKEWDRLKEAEQVYTGVTSKFVTNIAGYSVNADDEYTLIKIGNNAVSNKTEYTVEELALTAKTDVDDKTLKSAVDGDAVQATTDTQYYFVLKGKNQEITAWVGYANAPKTVALADTAKAYAVTTKGAGNYDVAEVIVFESVEANPYDLYFVYDETNYDAITIGYNTETEAYESDMYVEIDDADDVAPIDFYNIFADGTVAIIDEDYADENIYAAQVETAYRDVNRRDYVKVEYADGEIDEFYEDQVTVYVVGQTARDYTVSVAEDKIDINDELIIVTDVKGNIEYIINATQSIDKDEDTLIDVLKLYRKIAADATKPTGVDAVLAELAKYDTVAEITSDDDVTAANKALVEAAKITKDDVTATKWDALQTAIAAVNTAITTYTDNNEKATALANAKDAAKAKIQANLDNGANWSDAMKAAAFKAIEDETDTTKTATDLYNAAIAAAKVVKENEAAEAAKPEAGVTLVENGNVVVTRLDGATEEEILAAIEAEILEGYVISSKEMDANGNYVWKANATNNGFTSTTTVTFTYVVNYADDTTDDAVSPKGASEVAARKRAMLQTTVKNLNSGDFVCLQLYAGDELLQAKYRYVSGTKITGSFYVAEAADNTSSWTTEGEWGIDLATETSVAGLKDVVPTHIAVYVNGVLVDEVPTNFTATTWANYLTEVQTAIDAL